VHARLRSHDSLRSCVLTFAMIVLLWTRGRHVTRCSYRLQFAGVNVTTMYSMDVAECGRAPNYYRSGRACTCRHVCVLSIDRKTQRRTVCCSDG
jgi:hypothetical protein